MYIFLKKNLFSCIYLCTAFMEYKKSLLTFMNETEIRNIFPYNWQLNTIHTIYIQLLKITIMNGTQKLIITKINIFSLLWVICLISHLRYMFCKICFSIILLSMLLYWLLTVQTSKPNLFLSTVVSSTEMTCIVITWKVWTLKFFVT